jgi:hypothetical protein
VQGDRFARRWTLRVIVHRRYPVVWDAVDLVTEDAADVVVGR